MQQGAERTAAAFVPNPFSSEAGARLYASGFQVRLDANGSCNTWATCRSRSTSAVPHPA